EAPEMELFLCLTLADLKVAVVFFMETSVSYKFFVFASQRSQNIALHLRTGEITPVVCNIMQLASKIIFGVRTVYNYYVIRQVFYARRSVFAKSGREDVFG